MNLSVNTVSKINKIREKLNSTINSLMNVLWNTIDFVCDFWSSIASRIFAVWTVLAKKIWFADIDLMHLLHIKYLLDYIEWDMEFWLFDEKIKIWNLVTEIRDLIEQRSLNYAYVDNFGYMVDELNVKILNIKKMI